tara:strand:- start:33663 stop:34280 length:618 start_codon:yes stop_codon:yes gene_type:complete
MKGVMNTPTEFWKGNFGDEYHTRNQGRIEANMAMFSFILDCNEISPRSVIEFGAGMGENLIAIKRLCPQARALAVEVNAKAVAAMREVDVINTTMACSIQEFNDQAKAELVLTKGLLIHLAPEDLPAAYKALYEASTRWILVCEYYSQTPREINYRGHTGKAWARDFAGEILDTYKDLKLLHYGFQYHRDKYPQDDINWFLMEHR